MPWMVAGIGVASFLAGFTFAHGRWALGLLLAGVAVGIAFGLRWFVVTTLEMAYERGAGYSESTRRRIRDLHEAKKPPETLKGKPVNGPPL